MKNLLNLNGLYDSSPNQTGETQSRQNRTVVKPWSNRGQVVLTLLFFLTLGVGNAWAVIVNGGRFYFDATNFTTRNSIQFAFTKGDNTWNENDRWSEYATMNNVSHTLLYYYERNSGWDNLWYIAIIGNSSAWTSCKCYHNNISNAASYTAPYNGSYTFNNNTTYYLTTASNQGGTLVTPNNNNIPTTEQTVKTYLDGSLAGTSPAQIKITSYYKSGEGVDCAIQSTATTESGGGNSTQFSCIITAQTTLSVSSVGSGKNFIGWYKEDGTLLSTSPSYTYYASTDNTIHARFETLYSVTVSAGANGTTSPSSVNDVGYYTPSSDITATPNTGYYLVNWTLPDGVTAAAGYSNTTNPIRINATAASQTITANFAPTWAILGSQASNTSSGTDGFGGWSTSNTTCLITNYTGDVGYVDVTLEANKKYEFKMYERNSSGGTHYGNNTSVQYMQYTPDEKHTNWAFSSSYSKNCGIATAGAGTYRFNWNQSTKRLTVGYPVSYTVTFGYGTGGSSVTATVEGATTITTGQYAAAGKDVTFSQTPLTGYTFKGWYTAASGGSAVSGMTTSDNVLDDIGTNANVYAQYTANTYKITFDATTNDGAISNYGSSVEESGARKITATYDATVSGTMPTALKNGYYFKGWYTAASGGDQVINPNGEWQNVSGYTNSSKQWKRAENTTLYAQYGTPEFSSVAFTPASVLPLETVTVTPSFDHNPEGNSTLCYVLTTGTGAEMAVQPTFSPTGEDNAVSFEAPATPGTYSVDIRLFNANEHSCADRVTGLVSTYSHATSFTVEASNAVTVQYKCGNVELRPSTTIYATSNQTAATVTAPEIPGLTFSNWTLGSGVSTAGGTTTSSNPIQIHATGNSTLTANYSQSGYVYFKNTLGWDNVYLHEYNNRNYWDGAYGTGVTVYNEGAQTCTVKNIEMTLLEGTTDVYYCKPDNVPAANTSFVFTNKTSTDQFFGSTGGNVEAVRVNDDFNSTNHMIVPSKNYSEKKNLDRATYYTRYFFAPTLMDWGWTLRGDWGWTDEEHYGHFTAPVMGSLKFTTSHYYDSYGSRKEIVCYNGNTKTGHSGANFTASATGPEYISAGDNVNIGITPNIAGEYIFTLEFAEPLSTIGGMTDQIKLSVTYPVVVGDFRLFNTDEKHPGNVVKKRANGKDVVDMYVADENHIQIQTCSNVSVANVTWGAPATATYAEGIQTVLEDSLTSPTCGPGVYSFTIEQDADGANPKITKVEKYTGRFYVRTNCVNDDKWNYKDSKDDHAMTYSEYSTTLTKKSFSHYFVKDIHANEAGYPASVNIRFTVATENSEAITDTIFDGDASGDYQDFFHDEDLNRTANVRFTYNQATNKIWRAYTEGPTNDNYMRLKSNGSNVFVVNNDGTQGDPNGNIKFNDRNNWVYELDVYANVGAYVKLTAEMHDHSNTAHTQYLKGIDGNGTDNTQWTADDAELLLGGTGTAQHMRITYDFKTDRMITAWLPSGTIATGSTMDIEADVLLIRKHQLAGQSITIEGTGKLTNINTVYGVMQFEKDSLNDVTKSRYSRNLYWISFPFDVKLSDVFGVGTYGQHWIIEYYDGKERAEKGYWADSPGFWKFVTPDMRDTYVLKANQGYVLALNLDKFGDGENGSTLSSVWGNNVTTTYLYFPSKTEIGNLELVANPPAVPIDQNGYQCTIDRTGLSGAGADINKNRTVADSYWHMIGAPSFADAGRTGLGYPAPTTTITENVLYVYKWNPTTNLYSVQSTSGMTFNAMHSYMVQYSGESIAWTNVTATPSTSVARRRQSAEDIHFAEFRLDLNRGEEGQDHTFVRLSDDEETTANFDFNKDLMKEFNAGKANIYTVVTGYLPTAGNTLPLSTSRTTVVPVGVQIKSAGDYTFAMPEGTNGVGVTLLDNETGVRTSLSALDYTVNLEQGTYDSRFLLEISPVQNTPTDLGNVQGDNEGTKVRKVLIDGILYIVKDGKLFDARGTLVR